MEQQFPAKEAVRCALGDQLSEQGDQSGFQAPPLPSVASVQSAASRLSEAVALHDGTGAVNALRELGVLALCPPTELLFNRLEFRVGCVVGPAQVVPLVELALMAAELRAYERAATYVVKAQALQPGAPELHDLNTVGGLIALNAGEVAKAKECLSESVRVCEQNEFACLACSIHPFNLLLAQELLKRDEHAAVITYFSRCQSIWQYEAKRIALWIEAIRNSETPDFQTPSFRNAMDRPAAKIRALAIRSSFLPVQDETSFAISRQDLHTAREEMRAEYKRQMAAAIRGKLDKGRN
jgi:tetratricopeptide (TPR) repeat protein